MAPDGASAQARMACDAAAAGAIARLCQKPASARQERPARRDADRRLHRKPRSDGGSAAGPVRCASGRADLSGTDRAADRPDQDLRRNSPDAGHQAAPCAGCRSSQGPPPDPSAAHRKGRAPRSGAGTPPRSHDLHQGHRPAQRAWPRHSLARAGGCQPCRDRSARRRRAL
ncbi:hypothetical protein D3C72_1577900 [compost metagenome]